MHTRYLRALELTRDAPRRVINLTQKSGSNLDIEAVSSAAVPANQVITGAIYQHSGGGGIPDYVAQGINETRLHGLLSAQPYLTAPLSIIAGTDLNRDTQQNHDKQMLRKLERQSTALDHGPGYLVHVWELSSFAGSSSTVSLRSPVAGDRSLPRPTRIIAPPPAPPPPPPAGAPPAAPPPTVAAAAARQGPAPVRAQGRRTSYTPPQGRIPGRVVNAMYLIGTTFRRS
jgi:hypothetical protein